MNSTDQVTPSPRHVDDFIDGMIKTPKDTGDVTYARWFFMLHRLPASLQHDFGEYISKYRLFCVVGGDKVRVTGCSRLGDVWISYDHDRTTGYDRRVDVTSCSQWSKE